jgi:chemotaxis signal transduction protein
VKLERAKRKPAVRQTEDVILFTVGSMRFAIAANAVDEIRNLDGLTPLRHGYMSKLGKVKYTLVREKKDSDVTYFVVDAAAHYGIARAKSTRVLVLRGAAAAVLVDSIERMTQIATISKLPRAFHGEELEWYRGFATVEAHVVPVVEPSSFLNKGEVAVLQAEARKSARAANEVPA